MRKYLIAGAGVLAAWTSLSAALVFAMPAGRSLAVLASDRDGVRLVVGAGGLPLRQDRLLTIARSDEPGFVARLYAAGALLVLDAEEAGGCSGRAPTRRAGSASL
jgi:hypothetical protein